MPLFHPALGANEEVKIASCQKRCCQPGGGTGNGLALPVAQRKLRRHRDNLVLLHLKGFANDSTLGPGLQVLKGGPGGASPSISLAF